MKESDWKTFKKIKEKAVEKFYQNALADFSEIIHDNNEPHHSRYLKLCQSVQESDEELGLIFDGLSRSRASQQLLAMRSRGLADETLLQELSEEFLHRTDPEK